MTKNYLHVEIKMRFSVECHFVGWYKEPRSLFRIIEVICNTPVAQCIQQQCVYPKHLLLTPHLL